jgi:hypothetical protein
LTAALLMEGNLTALKSMHSAVPATLMIKLAPCLSSARLVEV